ncbi:hypothetical protein, partial [Bradyrhizobium canariense]|uniref:hypothetical protein n=1 Tax=Bradyrhizobium canariense TaxID=255045 RepID=UPI001A7E19B8
TCCFCHNFMNLMGVSPVAEHGCVKGQSTEIAKDLSSCHGGSSPAFNYALNTNLMHPQSVIS